MTKSVFGACITSITVSGTPTDLWLRIALTDVVGEKALTDLPFLQKSFYAGFRLELH